METKPQTEEEVRKCCGGSCHSKDKLAEPEKKQNEKQNEKASPLTVEELTDLLQRTHANFENYRKQMQLQIEDIKKMSARDIILQILPVLDNFELALKNMPDEVGNGKKKDFVQGMELIYAQLLELTQNNNVVAIETKDKDFDPYYHEALMKVPSEVPENKIMEEFQKGYMLHGKVLRHAKVKISAGPENKTNNQNKNGSKNENKTGGQ